MSQFQLRLWRESDAAAISRYANDWEVARWLRDVFPHPYTQADAAGFIQMCLTADPAADLLLAIDTAGAAVGSVSLSRGQDVYRRSAELGYWLGRSFWGQGIMSAAVGEICRRGFAQWDILRIYAGPFANNAASRRVLEKAGFTLEGVLRQSVTKGEDILDSCVYSLLREEIS